MFSINTFIEVQVVGLLLLLGLSPIVFLAVARYREAESFCPPLDRLQPSSGAAILLVVAAFTLGISANRLIDDVFDEVLKVEGKEWYKDAYNCLQAAVGRAPNARPPSGAIPADSACARATREFGTPPTGIAWALNGEANSYLTSSFKNAEYMLSDSSTAARAYFDRHKLFMRVMHGVVVAGFVFLAAMLVYDGARTLTRRRITDRYPVALYVATSVLTVGTFVAYRSEATSYYQRECELATRVGDCELFRLVPPAKDAKDAKRRARLRIPPRPVSGKSREVYAALIAFGAGALLLRCALDAFGRAAVARDAETDRASDSLPVVTANGAGAHPLDGIPALAPVVVAPTQTSGTGLSTTVTGLPIRAAPDR